MKENKVFIIDGKEVSLKDMEPLLQRHSDGEWLVGKDRKTAKAYYIEINKWIKEIEEENLWVSDQDLKILNKIRKGRARNINEPSRVPDMEKGLQQILALPSIILALIYLFLGYRHITGAMVLSWKEALLIVGGSQLVIPIAMIILFAFIPVGLSEYEAGGENPPKIFLYLFGVHKTFSFSILATFGQMVKIGILPLITLTLLGVEGFSLSLLGYIVLFSALFIVFILLYPYIITALVVAGIYLSVIPLEVILGTAAVGLFGGLGISLIGCIELLGAAKFAIKNKDFVANEYYLEEALRNNALKGLGLIIGGVLTHIYLFQGIVSLWF